MILDLIIQKVNKYVQHLITVLLRLYASMFITCFTQTQIIDWSANTKIIFGGVFKLLPNIRTGATNRTGGKQTVQGRKTVKKNKRAGP